MQSFYGKSALFLHYFYFVYKFWSAGRYQEFYFFTILLQYIILQVLIHIINTLGTKHLDILVDYLHFTYSFTSFHPSWPSFYLHRTYICYIYFSASGHCDLRIFLFWDTFPSWVYPYVIKISWNRAECFQPGRGIAVAWVGEASAHLPACKYFQRQSQHFVINKSF